MPDDKTKQMIYCGEKYTLPEGLGAAPISTNFDFVSALYQGMKEHDPNRSKALALFKKYSQQDGEPG